MAITPEYVNGLTAPTETFLCHLNANVFDINFHWFQVRALDPGYERVLFQAGTHEPGPMKPSENMDEGSRFIRYDFGPEFLNYTQIGATVEFTNGQYPLHNLRMIERHYFRDQLIQSYDFEMPFIIPNTKNTWEMIYTKPWLNDDWRAAMIAAPYEAKSDSFYFVNDQLFAHNRAEYSFAPVAAPGSEVAQ